MPDVAEQVRQELSFHPPPVLNKARGAVRKSGRKALVGRRAMTRVGRAIEKGETKGFMKIVADAQTKEILGATILGVGADEAIHAVLDCMYAKASCSALTRMVHIHPTVAELLPTIAGELRPLD
jgi:pyruvate/2-oxoglutarate dehydrogenase complex dihydrolipoamide dehydrogenase (E3) component